jgi:histone H3/H4
MRADILRVITQQMDIDEFDPLAIAQLTSGMTGSDLRLVIREAVLDALTDGRRTLTQEDLEAAVRDFEERDNLKNLDMIEGDHDALVAGGDISGSGDGGDGHAHDGDHSHSHDGDHDHAHDGGHAPDSGHSHGDGGDDATTEVRTAEN